VPGGVPLADPAVLRALGLQVAGAVLVTVLAVGLGAVLRSTAGGVGVGIALVSLAPPVLVSEPANHRFTGGSLTDTETSDLLGRWARWHHLRVVLGVVATVAAASAIGRRRS
jgi:hypothetical protein